MKPAAFMGDKVMAKQMRSFINRRSLSRNDFLPGTKASVSPEMSHCLSRDHPGFREARGLPVTQSLRPSRKSMAPKRENRETSAEEVRSKMCRCAVSAQLCSLEEAEKQNPVSPCWKDGNLKARGQYQSGGWA